MQFRVGSSFDHSDSSWNMGIDSNEKEERINHDAAGEPPQKMGKFTSRKNPKMSLKPILAKI